MPSIRLTSFGGTTNDVAARLMPINAAQIAHNCLLWDGSLRPLAKWTQVQGVDPTYAFSISLTEDNKYVLSSPLSNATYLKNNHFLPDTVVGLVASTGGNYANIFVSSKNTPPTGITVGVPAPIVSGGISYVRQNRSNKPVNRVYGVTAIRFDGDRVEESAMTLVPNQSPQSIVYEGDIAIVNVVASPAPGGTLQGLRLYRTMTGLDTGEGVTNELDTEFHLVYEHRSGSVFSYSDAGAATGDPLDVYLAKDFYPPPVMDYRFLDVTEGGWVVAATLTGNIIASERHLYHAWPTENRWDIPETVTDMKAQYDTVFIGTKNYPYSITIAPGEKLGLQGGVMRYPENYECLPGTMDSTPAGVVYTSPSGLVSVDREGMRLITAGVMSGVKAMYQVEYRYEVQDENGTTHTRTKRFPMRFQHTAYGLYYHGNYIGFTYVPSGMKDESDKDLFFFKAFMFNVGSSLDGTRELSRFVTLDAPPAVRGHTVGGSGIYLLTEEGVFSMAFPDSTGDEAYHKAEKYCYTWKSRKFVMPGETVFAAAKVDHDCGPVRLRIYADCCCIYDVQVKDCAPFLLPPNIVGTTWEIELQGSATVHEVHLATSLRDLLEHGNAR